MRYVVHPGYVRSQNDGQLHWITAAELLSLYNVPSSANIKVLDDEWSHRGYRPEPGDVHLHPRYRGDYSTAVTATPASSGDATRAMRATATVSGGDK